MDPDRPTPIQFTYTHPQRPLRLLELPPDLLTLLENPRSPPLKLKSRPAPPTANPSDRSFDAVLCTPDKTYTLRQVHSSNTGFLVRPTARGDGVTAVATVASVLELLPAAPDARAMIAPHLRVYEGWEEEDAAREEAGELWCKQRLRAELPVSDGEFEVGWRGLLGFEHAGGLWRPAAGTAVRALRTVVTAAVAEGVGLRGAVEVRRVCAAVEEEGVPAGLVEAVLRAVAEEGAGGCVTVDPEKCCRFAGAALLEDWWEQGKRRKLNDLMYVSFMMKWKGAVPDFCADHCRIEVLKGLYTLPTSNTIRYAPPEEPSTSLPIRNKWHEEFRKK